ncbi:hypothetical protein POPTR_006G177125v4 [Populus trichocarpa]|uniref:Uncharacterized protein n=1 Tax=Populus trichocarpa TaxID=3694 RepID=A0ACC0SUU8_POPTR|nr:hypothetical protein BDE02_06G153300 [Populus trichocarpa]KAI9393042.1 hypothetical protein POPTR_006G177125v4 [Populus trichocarpa]
MKLNELGRKKKEHGRRKIIIKIKIHARWQLVEIVGMRASDMRSKAFKVAVIVHASTRGNIHMEHTWMGPTAVQT